MTKVHSLYIAERNVESDGDNVCLQFITNASHFIINYVIKNMRNGNFPHVGITPRGDWQYFTDRKIIGCRWICRQEIIELMLICHI